MVYKDAQNFLSTLTLKKVVNYTQLIVSYKISQLLKKPIHSGKIASISIEPTTSCNLRCPQCPSGLRSFTRDTGMLEEQLFQKTIDDIYTHLVYLIFYFQGEPYLNPHFLKMVSYASQKNIYTATSTNAHYLDSNNAKHTVLSGLNRLIISIDGTTQEAFEKYRKGGNLEKVIEGTKNLVHWKRTLKSSTPHIIFQFIVMRHNESQLEEIKVLSKNIGVDELQLKTAQIYNLAEAENIIPINPKYSRYKRNKAHELVIDNPLLNNCWRMWHSCVATWDGKIVPCCFDKDATYALGQLKDTNINSIWKNDLYQNFRNKIAKSRAEIDICRNCSEGTKIFG